jgi:hypothetical protein
MADKSERESAVRTIAWFALGFAVTAIATAIMVVMHR